MFKREQKCETGTGRNNTRTCESEKEPVRNLGSKIYKSLILLKKLI